MRTAAKRLLGGKRKPPKKRVGKRAVRKMDKKQKRDSVKVKLKVKGTPAQVAGAVQKLATKGFGANEIK